MAYVLAMHPGNRLRELRKLSGLTQGELAEQSGVSQPLISQLENSAAEALDIARMRTFARIFGCKVADFLVEADNPDRLTDEERAHIAHFRAADDAQRELVRRVAAPLHKFEAEPRRIA